MRDQHLIPAWKPQPTDHAVKAVEPQIMDEAQQVNFLQSAMKDLYGLTLTESGMKQLLQSITISRQQADLTEHAIKEYLENDKVELFEIISTLCKSKEKQERARGAIFGPKVPKDTALKGSALKGSALKGSALKGSALKDRAEQV